MNRAFGFLGGAAARWRTLTAVVVAAAAFAMVPGGTPASASGNFWHAVGSASWHSSPFDESAGGGFRTGDGMVLSCYEYGAPAGPYSNTLWYFAKDLANNAFGWINDHYLDTPGTAANPQPQTWECYFPQGTDAVNAPSGVYWRNSPHWNDVYSAPTTGFNNGDWIHLDCYEFGGPAGPYGNTLWYYADDGTTGSGGWINDHYLDTPGTAAHPQPQTDQC
jgi:hypothetical protein